MWHARAPAVLLLCSCCAFSSLLLGVAAIAPYRRNGASAPYGPLGSDPRDAFHTLPVNVSGFLPARAKHRIDPACDKWENAVGVGYKKRMWAPTRLARYHRVGLSRYRTLFDRADLKLPSAREESARVRIPEHYMFMAPKFKVRQPILLRECQEWVFAWSPGSLFAWQC